MQVNRKVKSSSLTPRALAAGLALMAAFIAVVFFKTWCGMQCIRTGYQISDAEDRYQELVNTRKRLKIELVHLQSEAVLMSRARETFGLVVPEPNQIILLP